MKTISGGQTGADRAALDVAIEVDMDYAGAVPKGRMAEDGSLSPENSSVIREGSLLLFD